MRRITEWLRKRAQGRIRRLSGSGRAFVVSDLHGSLQDWRAFLARTEAIDRIAAGEDLYVVLTGDVPDVHRHRAVDPHVPVTGDVQILDELVEAQARLGPRGHRILYVEGNHDFHVARIAAEVARYHAQQRGARGPGPDELPAVTPEEYDDFCAHYRETYGDAIFDNNIGPYDMVPRARSPHLRLIKSGPVLVHFETAGVVILHAGPPRMNGREGASVLKVLDAANAETLRRATPDEYYASPYHQVLNNRFRNGDYSLHDVNVFLESLGAKTLITGHTPHPYLVDFERNAPLQDCYFRDGVGRIGERQVVLCTSFGAFMPSFKRYLELDLGRSYADARELLESTVRPLYLESEPSHADVQPLPGADLALDWA